MYFSGGVLVEQLSDHMRNEYINMNAQEPEKKAGKSLKNVQDMTFQWN